MIKSLSVFALSMAVAALVFAAPPPNTVTASFKWLPDNSQMAGLSTNDYCTNIVVTFLSTVNVNIPTNNWPTVLFTPITAFLSQGPPGTTWTQQLSMDGNARFYAIVMTNNNGGSSPFSNLAPGLTAPLAGQIVQPLKVSTP